MSVALSQRPGVDILMLESGSVDGRRKNYPAGNNKGFKDSRVQGFERN